MKSNIRRKNNGQLSLSQSLLRKKTRKLDSLIDKTLINETEGNASDSQGSEDISIVSKNQNTTSYSQPEDNDFDDSFDLFLPRKSPKKCPPPKPSSQSSFFEVRKTKKSRYFDESGRLQVPKVIKDDDLELAIALSLQESKGNAVSLKPTKTASGSVPRGKLKKACSQSLLMRRSAADRERIITEKVAIVLMNANRISAPPSPGSESRHPRLLYSAFLNEKFNTLNTLWKLSQADLTKIELARFYTNIVHCYVDTPFQDRAETYSGSSYVENEGEEECSDLHLAVSDEDIFGSSGDERLKGPSPKRRKSAEGSSFSREVKTTSNTSVELRTGSPEGATIASTSRQSTVSANKLSGEGMKRTSNTSGEQISLRVEASDLVAVETDADECCSPPVDCDAKTPVKEAELPTATLARNTTRHVICSSFTENHNFTFTKHHRKLSADLISLSTSDVSVMIKVRKEPETLFAHGCIFKARCPVLFDALSKNASCLDEFSFDVCQAVFGYIYSGDIRKAQDLKSEQKNQLAECCLRFGLEELAEELFLQSADQNSDGNHVGSPTETCLAKSPCEKVEHGISLAKVSGMKEELSVGISKPEKVNGVIVLDSDCCSVEEVLSSEPAAGDASDDDELNKYLKDGVRLLENNSSTPTEKHPGGERCSPSKVVSKEPKRSIDRYFQDSFPSLDGISVTPTPLRQCLETSGPTPCSSKGIRNCETPGGLLVVSELATPMPNYESMVTPDLKEALQKYGIKKGIGRRKAVTLLRYIYDQIHPPSDHPAVARAIGDVKSKANSVPPAPDSDSDVYTLSSDSSGDEMFEDLGDVFHSQAELDSQETSSKPGLLREVAKFIKSNTLLYAAVLKYEPIWLNKFHCSLKENGVKCNKKELIEVLDELGITFRTEQTEKQLQRRRNKKPTRRKK